MDLLTSQKFIVLFLALLLIFQFSVDIYISEICPKDTIQSKNTTNIIGIHAIGSRNGIYGVNSSDHPNVPIGQMVCTDLRNSVHKLMAVRHF